MDHDQRFKTLIREFFAEFLRLFFAKWADRFDLATVEWLDKEVLHDPPEGAREHLDLVARLQTRVHPRSPVESASTPWLALVHIEIESPDRTTNVKPRLPSYYIHLREKYGVPVLPIVIYLKVGLDGIGVDTVEEWFDDFLVMKFHYLYVGLPGLDAVEYVKGDNWLGVALSALMRIPKDRVAWLGAEAMTRLAAAPLSEQKRFLLADCVEAYLPLGEQEQQEYEKLLLGTSQSQVKAMNKTTYEKGMEKGIEKGVLGLQGVLLKQGIKRFGPPSREMESKVHSIQDIDRLEDLAVKILDAQSWDDWLPAN